jgi:alkylation response protein AidB-like acyl-CoA dehydrogenase
MLHDHVYELSPGERALQRQVRAFLADALPPGSYRPCLGMDSRSYSPDFSKLLAAQGWVGMSVPPSYGGSGMSAVERYIVTEELLAVGAPIGAHWVADRQTVSLLKAFGTEEQRQRFLPRISRGECYFAVGLSEPDSGSDLASVRTKATRVDGGWSVNGTKIWTSGAQHTHHMVILCRTSAAENKHAGLSQLIVDLSSPGLELHPIETMNRQRHFNEVALVDVFVPDADVVGEIDSGWAQVTSELAFERTGADRLLTTWALVEQFVRAALTESTAAAVGELVARLWGLRRTCLAVARAVDDGLIPKVEASMTKDLGTHFEQEVVAVISDLAGAIGRVASPRLLDGLIAEATLMAPAYTIRGGTTEILRGVISRAVVPA